MAPFPQARPPTLEGQPIRPFLLPDGEAWLGKRWPELGKEPSCRLTSPGGEAPGWPPALADCSEKGKGFLSGCDAALMVGVSDGI